MIDALGDHDAVGLAELVRAGEVKPLELVDAAIARIETVDPQLNAVIHRASTRPAPRRRRAGARRRAASAACRSSSRTSPAHPAGEPFHEGMRVPAGHGWRSHARHLPRRQVPGRRPRHRRADQHARARHRCPPPSPQAYGPTRNPWDPVALPRRVERRVGGGGGRRAGAGRPRQRRRRLDPHPGQRLRARRPQAVTRAGRRSGPTGDVIGGLVVCEHVVCRDGARHRRHPRRHRRPHARRPLRRRRRRPARSRDEVGADPGRLRIGAADRRPRRPRRRRTPSASPPPRPPAGLLESLGHDVERRPPGGARPARLDRPTSSACGRPAWPSAPRRAGRRAPARAHRRRRRRAAHVGAGRDGPGAAHAVAAAVARLAPWRHAPVAAWWDRSTAARASTCS